MCGGTSYGQTCSVTLAYRGNGRFKINDDELDLPGKMNTKKSVRSSQIGRNQCTQQTDCCFNFIDCK